MPVYPMIMDQLSIVVLLGGPSAERAVSLLSGDAVARALEERGHRVVRLDPNPDRPADVPLEGTRSRRIAEKSLRAFDWANVDIVFNALHGRFGEAGVAQCILDELRIPYTGSGADVSHWTFDKVLAKERFRRAGVPTPRGHALVDLWISPSAVERLASELGYPVVVKPSAQGSSLGVAIVRSPQGLAAAVSNAYEFRSAVLLEEYIPGTEWTVPVWDDKVLPVIQIVPANEFFDYQAKYSDDRTEYRFEFDVAPEIVQRVADAGLRAAQSLGLQGLSRADIRLTPDGRPYVLEVNSSPGMTDHSLVPKAAARAGWSMGALCEEECRRAMQRQRV